MTTVPRTIADVARSGLSDERVRQAIQEAVDRGPVGFMELNGAAKIYGGGAARIIRRYLRQNAP